MKFTNRFILLYVSNRRDAV